MISKSPCNIASGLQAAITSSTKMAGLHWMLLLKRFKQKLQKLQKGANGIWQWSSWDLEILRVLAVATRKTNQVHYLSRFLWSPLGFRLHGSTFEVQQIRRGPSVCVKMSILYSHFQTQPTPCSAIASSEAICTGSGTVWHA